MSQSETEHLIKMANQIATNMAPGFSEEEAADRVADHIRKFWAGPMKTSLKSCAETNAEACSPIVLKAVERI